MNHFSKEIKKIERQDWKLYLSYLKLQHARADKKSIKTGKGRKHSEEQTQKEAL